MNGEIYKGHTLSLTEGAYYIFYLKIPENLSNWYIDIKCGTRITRHTENTVRPVTVGDEELSYIVYEVFVVNSIDDITLELFDGSETSEIVTVHSMASYLRRVYELHINDEETSRNYKMAKLAEAYLNVIGFLQINNNYKTSTMANDGIDTSAVLAVTRNDVAQYGQPQTSGECDSVTYAGIVLQYTYANTLQVYFNAQATSGFTVYVDDEEVTPTFSGRTFYTQIRHIRGYELAKEHTVKVVEGDNTLTVRLSPLSYINLISWTNQSQANLLNLLKATHIYYLESEELANPDHQIDT